MKLGRSGWRFRRRGAAAGGSGRSVLSDAAERELLAHGLRGAATIVRIRGADLVVAVALDDPARAEPYRTRVRDRFTPAERGLLRPGAVLPCRVDPGDQDRVLLCVPGRRFDPDRLSPAAILADGRRAAGVVLAVAATGRHTPDGAPVLRLDLELTAGDEPAPWRVRTEQPVPLTAVPLLDLGSRLAVAFFAVDDGATVTIDWPARGPGYQ